MPGLTETELMTAYDKTLPPASAPIMDTTAKPVPLSPRLTRIGDRICRRGHLVPYGGKCMTCKKLGDHSVSKKVQAKRRSRCDRGHILSDSNVITTKRTRKDGSVYQQRNCRTCYEARKSRKYLNERPSVFGRAKARVRIAQIDEFILNKVDGIELMSSYELAVWNEERLALVKERDALTRRCNLC